MISVSTGGPRIDTVNEEYQKLKASIWSRLSELGLEDPNPFQNLWEWYGRWSGGDLPSYHLRRAFVRDMYSPLVETLARFERGEAPSTLREPTGWPLVDRQTEKVKAQLARSTHEEDFQAVGLLARELLISLAQTVYAADRHKSLDGVPPSDTDAGRMLEAYIHTEMSGPRNEDVRRHAKAALKLAVALQHKRTADITMAALCCEATASVVSVIAILAGRRRGPADSASDA